MREIKIRAWDANEHEMHYDVLTDIAEVDMWDDERSCWDIAHDIESGTNYTNVFFMEYTGTKDTYETEIYEDDIVRVVFLDNSKQMEYTTVVKYDTTGYSPMNWVYHCDECDYYVEIISLEVIGNIYQNPELLKECAK